MLNFLIWIIKKYRDKRKHKKALQAAIDRMRRPEDLNQEELSIYLYEEEAKWKDYYDSLL
jgi:hypothetical protein